MSPPTPAQLGRAIREAREERKLSIEGLAAKASISWQYLSSIERGKPPRNPTWTVVGGVAEALGLDISELAERAEALDAEQIR